MHSFPATQQEFYQELAELRQRFQAMEPELEMTVRDPAQGVEGYVVVWNTGISLNGPLPACGKGGTRIKSDLKFDDVKRLARAMAEKNAAAGLPLGGAKSGMRMSSADPDYERKFRRFVQLCKPVLHENGGIFGGFGYDVGCKPPFNAQWACDELKSLRCFTGKPVDMGGTDYDKVGIAGLGVAVAGKTLLEQNGVKPAGATFSVQGLGAMGAAVVRYFSAYGGVLKAVSDPKYGGTWLFDKYPSQTLVDALAQQDMAVAQTLLATEGRKVSEDSAEALYAPVDVLFPCALEDVLRADNAAKVQARFMAEGANNPTSDEAHEILHQNAIKVVPDVIANSGGIIAAFVELTSRASLDDNIRNRTKVEEAKNMTIQKVSSNTQQLAALISALKVRGDLAGDYMAYRNVFFGLT